MFRLKPPSVHTRLYWRITCACETPFKINALDPGYTAPDFNNHQRTGTVQEVGARIAKYAMIDADGATSKFVSKEHNPETGEILW